MNNIAHLFQRLQNGNDIRGTAIAASQEPVTLTPDIASILSYAFVQFVSNQSKKSPQNLKIGVGYDSRITAQTLKTAVLKGLLQTNAFDCGCITTPAMFQSTILPPSDFDAAIMITASHLPFNRNGLKFFTKAHAVDHDELQNITDIATRTAAQFAVQNNSDPLSLSLARPLPGNIPPMPFDMKSVYCSHMKNLIIHAVDAADRTHPLKGLHIIEDAGNGAAGFFATDILQPLGANISGSVFLNPDGNFPNHIPNPENQTAMDAAKTATLNAHADLGVIFDCDGDRAAVVLSDGSEINRNALIALLAAIVQKSSPHSTIVTDSITSNELTDFIQNVCRLKHLRFKRGYKNVIDKAIDLNAQNIPCELAIETSGHGAFKENHFSDDGAYIALKIISALAKLKKNNLAMQSLIDKLQYPADAREIRFNIHSENFADYADDVIRKFAQYIQNNPNYHIVSPNYEGIRFDIHTPDLNGWCLLRKSLHDPCMPMNIESDKINGTAEILNALMPFFRQFKLLSIQ